MKPPRCARCGADDPSCVLVQFADYVPLPDGVCGHPEGLEWFCAEQASAARALTTLPRPDALAKMQRRWF